MISVDSVISKIDAKVKTTKKATFDQVMELDKKVTFSELSDLLLMAFAIGYRKDEICADTGGNAFVNVSSIDTASREEYVRLILHRHPDIPNENGVWQKVQEYADAGIDEIYNMFLNGKKFSIDQYIEIE